MTTTESDVHHDLPETPVAEVQDAEQAHDHTDDHDHDQGHDHAEDEADNAEDDHNADHADAEHEEAVA